MLTNGLLRVVFTVLLSTVCFAQVGPQPGPQPPLPQVAGMPCVRVPSQFATIYGAVSSGAACVEAEPGYYRENVWINGRSVVIRAAIPDTVVVDGGEQVYVTFSTTYGGSLRLENLTIINNFFPPQLTYNNAAVFAEFGGSVEVIRCKIYTKTQGVVANYTGSMRVDRSVIIGPPKAVGVAVMHQNQGGSTVTNNVFYGVGTGIDASENYFPPILCDGPCVDSNLYHNVITAVKRGKY